MASLKGDRFLQFTISSGNKFQSLIVAGKKEDWIKNGGGVTERNTNRSLFLYFLCII